MFKKLKDKLAEEVKSSPQRIQQFAQAAQAAVTSASSSISDITNSELFSIGDNDGQQPRPARLQPSPSGRQNTFQDMSLAQPIVESMEYTHGQDTLDNQRHRRLSNSSLASDISFRLPSYETPSMYHLQSDIDVTASEAEESGFASGVVSLDRVTKEQLYAAYKRTQERYKKYRTQYGDLARHYKLLERENAKARSVLVETQDKALRRISELKEQCSLEQSAKAHLEKSLRVEIEEKCMTIDALNTKVKILQNNIDVSDNTNDEISNETVHRDADVQLINLSSDNEIKSSSEDSYTTETTITNLNNKIEKIEQLLNKYKESLKSSKEKNSQVSTELKILSNELENKNKEIEQLKITAKQLEEANKKIQDLSNLNEDLQNKINTYDFTKSKEMSEIEMDLQKAREEVTQLQSKIEVFSKREEEYAISLAENKLSIHKELENKETEIKSLKENLSSTQKEVESLNIVINDYKIKLFSLEEERLKLINENQEYSSTKSKIIDLESQLQDLTKKQHLQEHMKTKADEEYKCLQLQLKQETAEKLAMIDRNDYLENKNTHLSKESEIIRSQICSLQNELQLHKKSNINIDDIANEKQEMTKELELWKSKFNKLESEIQEEREELVKLQSEIEKLLANHEQTQKQNIELREAISDLKAVNTTLQDQITIYDGLKTSFKIIASDVSKLHDHISITSSEAVSLKDKCNIMFIDIANDIKDTIINFRNEELAFINNQYESLKTVNNKLQQELNNESEHNLQSSKIVTSLQDENNKLKVQISKAESERDSLNKNNIKIDLLYKAALNDIEALKNEQKELISKIQENANKSKDFEDALDFEKTRNLSLCENIALLQNENKQLAEKLYLCENKNKYITEEVEHMKNELEVNVGKLEIMTKENKELKEKIIISEGKNKYFSEQLDKLKNDLNINIEQYSIMTKENKALKIKSEGLDHTININKKLQDNINAISEENNSLKNQIEKIASNIKDQEAEIIELRKSHTEIEIEKDRLNAIIEKIESKDNIKIDIDAFEKCTQTDEITNLTKAGQKALFISQNNKVNIQNEKYDDNVSENVYKTLKTEYEVLKDENRRLQSDVDGLQKYLTKISKENSVLNDKLRELIATSENSTEVFVPNDITKIQNEVQTCRDKIENLLRENSLLIEENYELKDQLQSQKFSPRAETINNDNNVQLSGIKEQYNNLVQSTTKLEHKLLESEQLNRSLHSNMQQIQDKYEKLKIVNDKLERKLDEALVSLRHLHSLQENTELEYLRNILYEYLTGSGMHSVTLAKVLSAIVKFDDSQTQLVLQKEKERQGFLRQLGLI